MSGINGDQDKKLFGLQSTRGEQTKGEQLFPGLPGVAPTYIAFLAEVCSIFMPASEGTMVQSKYGHYKQSAN